MVFETDGTHIETPDSAKPQRSLLSALIGLVMFLGKCFIHPICFVLIILLAGVTAGLHGKDVIPWTVVLIVFWSNIIQEQRIKNYADTLKSILDWIKKASQET